MASHSKQDDGTLKIGSAAVVSHDSGGWAIPGGDRVANPKQAVEIARRMHVLIQQHGGYDPRGCQCRCCRGGAR